MNAPAPRPLATDHASAAPVPSFERRRLRLYIAFMLLDIAAIMAGFLVSGGVYRGEWPSAMALVEAEVLLPIYLTIGLYQGVYSIGSLTDRKFAIGRVTRALAVSSALLMFITVYTKSSMFSRGVFAIALVLSWFGLMALRLVMARLIRKIWGHSVMNVLVIQDGGPPISLDAAYVIDAAEEDLVPDPSDPHRLDQLGRCFVNMDRVVISCPPERRENWAFVLRAAGARGEVTSESLRDLNPLALREIGSHVTLVISTGPLGLRARTMKRLFDCAIAAFALAVSAPLMVLVALAIKLEDGGPVLFVQRRLGRGNCFFRMLKFRSMKVRRQDADGNRSASRGDDRCTRVGRFIRRTSIDELPQLLNVLKGEMSIVGPRPHAVGSQAGDKLFWEIDGHYWHRHSLKPGLTGLAQVRGWRGATEHARDLEGRLQADLEYIASWSLWKDFLIVCRTAGVLIHRRAF